MSQLDWSMLVTLLT